MSDPYASCKQVSPECPVSASAFGYAPNLAGNAILMTVFILCTIAQLGLAITYRTISFGCVVVVACAMEVAGYIGRIMLHKNVWGSGMSLQAIMLVVAPSFLAAGMFLTLKHVVMYLGPEYSRLPPKAWVWTFVGCDVVAVVLQAAGGGLASAANSLKMVNAGNNIMIAGLMFGVIVQFFCILLALDFGYSLRKHRREWKSNGQKSQATSKGFMFYAACTSIAFLFIWIRCIYRVPELWGGWGNKMMRKEAEFMILDGMMIALASILMTVAHPGVFFPAMSSRKGKGEGDALGRAESEEMVVVDRDHDFLRFPGTESAR